MAEYFAERQAPIAKRLLPNAKRRTPNAEHLAFGKLVVKTFIRQTLTWQKCVFLQRLKLSHTLKTESLSHRLKLSHTLKTESLSHRLKTEGLSQTKIVTQTGNWRFVTDWKVCHTDWKPNVCHRLKLNWTFCFREWNCHIKNTGKLEHLSHRRRKLKLP